MSKGLSKAKSDGADASAPPKKPRKRTKKVKGRASNGSTSGPSQDTSVAATPRGMSPDAELGFAMDFDGDITLATDTPMKPAIPSQLNVTSALHITSPPPPTSPVLLLPAHVLLPDADPSIEDGSGPNEPILSDSSDVEFVTDRFATRYFEELVCKRCNLKGHTFKNCTTLICSVCGSVDSHTYRECPLGVTCWNCGARGHIATDCPEPRERRRCDLCGSFYHATNSCSMHWRIYNYRSQEDRDDELRRRVDAYDHGNGSLDIGWSKECFNCSQSGHWGGDCPNRNSDDISQRENHAFSNFFHSHGPFSTSHRSSKSTQALVDQLEAVAKLSSHDGAYQSYNDTFNLPGGNSIGRQGREKAKRRAQEEERRALDALEDEQNDFFSKQPSSHLSLSANPRSQGKNSSSTRHADRRRDDKDSYEPPPKKQKSKHKGVRDEVGKWFDDSNYHASPRPPSKSHPDFKSSFRFNPNDEREREEEDFLAHQQHEVSARSQFNPNDQFGGPRLQPPPKEKKITFSFKSSTHNLDGLASLPPRPQTNGTESSRIQDSSRRGSLADRISSPRDTDAYLDRDRRKSSYERDRSVHEGGSSRRDSRYVDSPSTASPRGQGQYPRSGGRRDGGGGNRSGGSGGSYRPQYNGGYH